jgi:hypothetical protein
MGRNKRNNKEGKKEEAKSTPAESPKSAPVENGSASKPEKLPNGTAT